jgi:2-C-methyl-D-erythritol 4-phosphate cytidylyltransferase / 2-C-methyl-D-erythritol 2,4-cyclodiphosphate synthase
MTPLPRTGFGYDVHAFCEGDHIWLGGVKIPHTQGVLAHSDGDVLLHALTDALLGTMAEGDIGTHFPPSDPQWRGMSSRHFLQHALVLLETRGGRIIHIDSTVICEEPKLGLYRTKIRETLAEILRIPLRAVSVKATTSEQLGFTGRKEGIAAHAVITVLLPEGA